MSRSGTTLALAPPGSTRRNTRGDDEDAEEQSSGDTVALMDEFAQTITVIAKKLKVVTRGRGWP